MKGLSIQIYYYRRYTSSSVKRYMCIIDGQEFINKRAFSTDFVK